MSERITVVGSLNMDLVVRSPRIPQPGETIIGHEWHTIPGGKGANQALAAQRLGADVSLIACAGVDAAADEALSLLREGGVDLTRCRFVEDVASLSVLWECGVQLIQGNFLEEPSSLMSFTFDEEEA